jgi:hypothetical protein
MVWLSFAKKEFEPEFEIALSEDLFARPFFELFSERNDRVHDSPASANLLAQSVHFMALANAELSIFQRASCSSNSHRLFFCFPKISNTRL